MLESFWSLEDTLSQCESETTCISAQFLVPEDAADMLLAPLDDGAMDPEVLEDGLPDLSQRTMPLMQMVLHWKWKVLLKKFR